MHSQGSIFTLLQTKLLQNIKTGSHLLMLQQSIDHHITDKNNLFSSNPFLLQIFIGIMISCKQIITQHISTKPIDFFRHPHITRTQPSLYMCR